MKILTYLTNVLIQFPKSHKKFLWASFDSVGLVVVYWSCVELVLSTGDILSGLLLGFIYASLTVAIFWTIGVYRTVTRYAGINLLNSVIAGSTFALCVQLFILFLSGIAVSLVLAVLLFSLSVFVVAGARIFVRELNHIAQTGGKRVLIYGAGSAGRQLFASIKLGTGYDVIGFVDDEEKLQGHRVLGAKIFAHQKIGQLIKRERISMILLAMPSASSEELRKVLERIEDFPVEVKTIPSVSELLKSESPLSSLVGIQADDLLGRDRVKPIESLIRDNVINKVILVTGAGGTIGSELCRQILLRRPSKLLLYDISEAALYQIIEELNSQWGDVVLPLVGSVNDEAYLSSLLKSEGVDIVFHAAAYKHVPIMETNAFAAVKNNIYGTQALINASLSSNVSSFVLVSTDKAVRPTNIMGATKRVAEITCQITSASNLGKIKIAIVRFGNVIDSSGSAIPKFRQQIRRGGPVTVTHPEITRYFMAVSEAVELVLQASGIAVGGDVFVLDMGPPIKISDLVKKLIRFSGLNLYDARCPKLGGIKIKYTGLRPGEKLYEELLISEDCFDTMHPKIKRIKDPYPSFEEYVMFMEELGAVVKCRDLDALKRLLSRQEVGYVSTKGIADSIGKRNA